MGSPVFGYIAYNSTTPLVVPPSLLGAGASKIFSWESPAVLYLAISTPSYKVGVREVIVVLGI
jgi:hypothetical protein